MAIKLFLPAVWGGAVQLEWHRVGRVKSHARCILLCRISRLTMHYPTTTYLLCVYVLRAYGYLPPSDESGLTSTKLPNRQSENARCPCRESRIAVTMPTMGNASNNDNVGIRSAAGNNARVPRAPPLAKAKCANAKCVNADLTSTITTVYCGIPQMKQTAF